MNIHEYQAKALLRDYGVAVAKGQVAFTPEEATAAAEALGGSLWVVKSQIHAGGRGKGKLYRDGVHVEGGGGVRLARSIEEVRSHAAAILGATLVTHQTGPEGKVVNRLYIEEGCDIARELYLGITLDRGTGRLCLMASTEGGVEIETVAEETPDKIFKAWVDPAVGLQGYQARELAFALGLEGAAVRSGVRFLMGLYRFHMETDCSMSEINPLVVTGSGDVIALDAKVNFDDNALFRHKDLEELRDITEENEQELEAGKYNLSYIKLDGNIGCLVNGAGLAMATMDIIKFYGAEPANFLDVGGGANAEKVSAAFRIITADPSVEGILVNIFGGIMRCDVIAQGMIDALSGSNMDLPLVVRLAGTRVDEGKALLAQSGLPIITADTMADGAEKVVAAVKARGASA